jgi:hypothetical protein
MYKYFPSGEGKTKTLHNIQEANTMEDMGTIIPRIYASLEDRQVKHQSHMIEVEGKIKKNWLVSILNDSEASHSYIDPKIVEIFHLKKNKLERSWLVQLAIGTKIRINETFIYYPINMNGVYTKFGINIIPLGSYDITNWNGLARQESCCPRFPQ